MKNKILLLIIIAWIMAYSQNDNPVITVHGMGARAYGMANNYVALSNDAASLFYNPAGMAFTPVREFQFSIAGNENKVSATFFDGSDELVRQRVVLGSIANLWSVPTNRGGMSFTLGYFRPYTLDNLQKYSGNFIDAANDHISVSNDNYTYGQLNFWSAGAGIQVAPGTSVGTAISFVTGSSTMKQEYQILTNGVAENVATDAVTSTISRNYYGYDVRFGAMYYLNETIHLGLCIVVPQTIAFKGNETYVDTNTYTYEVDGKLTNSWTGTCGISVNFFWGTFSVQGDFRAPNPDAAVDEPRAQWNGGAGIGLEIPVFQSLLLRGGYSWHEYERNMFEIAYDPDLPIETEKTVLVQKNPQLITAGIAYVIKNALSFELSYGYRFWEYTTGTFLNESKSTHRLLVSIVGHY